MLMCVCVLLKFRSLVIAYIWSDGSSVFTHTSHYSLKSYPKLVNIKRYKLNNFSSMYGMSPTHNERQWTGKVKSVPVLKCFEFRAD